MFSTHAVCQEYQTALALTKSQYHIAMLEKNPAWIATRNDPAVRLLHALFAENFSFAREPWHDIENAQRRMPSRFTTELLLRAEDTQGPIAPFPAIAALNGAGIATALDKALVLAAIDQACSRDEFPVSINLAAQTVTDKHFWEWVRDRIPELYPNLDKNQIMFEPTGVTFEVTEDATAVNAPLMLIKSLKDSGYRIAIDDFTTQPFDEERLANLASLVDFVKIHGKVIEKGRVVNGVYSNPELIDTITRIRAVAPDAYIIAEWVKTPQEAVLLRKLGIDGAQGRDLPSSHDQFIQALHAVRQQPQPKV